MSIDPTVPRSLSDPEVIMQAAVHDVHDDDEIDDAALVAMFKKGVLGIPLVFAIALLIALPGAGWPTAPLIALLPALFAGPWLGMTVALMSRRATPPMFDVTGTSAPSDEGHEVPPVLDHAA